MEHSFENHVSQENGGPEAEARKSFYGREPFELRPLRLRGIFGAAWQIYKRGFLSMLVLTLLLTGVPGLLVSLVSLDFVDAAMAEGTDMFAGLQALRAIFSFVGVSMLVSLLTTFLLSPMYGGTAAMEYARRMRGGVSGTKALLKSCGKGLKGYYTTFLALWVTRMGIQAVVFILTWFGAIFGVIGIASSGILGGEPSLSAILGFALIILFILLVALVADMFLSFAYPVAVNEGKPHFKAVGRSFKLVGKRFWRVLGVSALSWLIVMGISLLSAVPAVVLMVGQEGNTAMILLTSMLSILISLVTGPYLIAIQHTLYYDAVAREAGEKPFDPQDPLSGDAPPAPPESPVERRFDPVTGVPVPPRRFDPITGEPLPPAYRFDPMTGKPIEKPPFPFDPKTGEVLTPPEASEASEVSESSESSEENR